MQGLQRGDRSRAGQAVAQAREAGWPQVFPAALEAIIAGARNPALADDSALSYSDAAEVALLLERLGG